MEIKTVVIANNNIGTITEVNGDDYTVKLLNGETFVTNTVEDIDRIARKYTKAEQLKFFGEHISTGMITVMWMNALKIDGLHDYPCGIRVSSKSKVRFIDQI